VRFAEIVIGGYLLGSCPWGYWLVRIFRREDVRKVGSGNIGGSNVWRTYGSWLGLPVILADLLKGFVPAFVGVHEVSHLCGICAGAAAMLGHWRPLFLRFERGGKMVATGAGAFFALAFWAILISAVIWLTTFLVTKYASVASIISAIVLPIAAELLGYPGSVVIFAVIAAAAVVFLHRANLSRLRSGTENRSKIRVLRRAPV
jgi:acyl phosphate:glycerol-3-phosphate acyltransferase